MFRFVFNLYLLVQIFMEIKTYYRQIWRSIQKLGRKKVLLTTAVLPQQVETEIYLLFIKHCNFLTQDKMKWYSSAYNMSHNFCKFSFVPIYKTFTKSYTSLILSRLKCEAITLADAIIINVVMYLKWLIRLTKFIRRLMKFNLTQNFASYEAENCLQTLWESLK